MKVNRVVLSFYVHTIYVHTIYRGRFLNVPNARTSLYAKVRGSFSDDIGLIAIFLLDRRAEAIQNGVRIAKYTAGLFSRQLSQA